VEDLTMPTDPLTAVLDQLAAQGERIGEVDAREAANRAALTGQLAQLAGMITTIGRALAEDTTAMARLEALDRQVAELARRLPGRDDPDGEEGYQPHQAPAWWQQTATERKTPIAELRDWAEHVYRPGYGHLVTLGPCWPQHDLCLYALDILSQLWSVLYLQPDRSASLLSAQAEYQARILPALSAQMTTETTSCDHNIAARYRRSTQ
jgi:hypothetical protein